MEILSIKNLHKRFADKEVLRGLNMTVPENSIFGFVGKNGAGKTTTMKTVLGLLRPDEGEITVAGEKVNYGETATNKYIGYLPDVPEFYGFMTAREYLRFCGEITGMEKSDIKDRSKMLLDMVGLSNEKHRIKGYSRGMKQRLGIVQALLNRPKLLICDEPTSALDPVGRKEILDILMTVREETTVLFSTHILSDVERICTDVAFLKDGVITMHGKPDELRFSNRTEEYSIEFVKPSGLEKMKKAFPKMEPQSTVALRFYKTDYDFYKVLGFISENKIPIICAERVEPTLESLFIKEVGQGDDSNTDSKNEEVQA